MGVGLFDPHAKPQILAKGGYIMSTYDYDKVMSDYANGRITVEMAMGHSLQHIGKLYETITIIKNGQHEWQTKTDAVEKRAHTLQVAVDRLTAFMDKVLHSQKRNAAGKQPKA